MNTVYRAYNCVGILLYVGCASNFAKRFYHHQRYSEWWIHAARIELSHHKSLKFALAEEKKAIHTEKPRHNITHNPEPPKRDREMTNRELRDKIRTGDDFTVKTISERKRALMVAKILKIEIIIRERKRGGYLIFIPSDVPN